VTDANGRVGRTARLLGAAGLLPQVAAVTVLAWVQYVGSIRGVRSLAGIALSVAFLYPALILSFLGGMWWTIAMRRTEGQGRLAAVAVLPTLIAFAMFASMAVTPRFDRLIMALGVAIMATLLVDGWLEASGEAPVGWLRLRAPLSLGLGALTIVAGVLIGGPVLGV